MDSQIDELLIMPSNAENKLKIRGKMFGKRVHSKCILIMVKILREKLKYFWKARQSHFFRSIFLAVVKTAAIHENAFWNGAWIFDRRKGLMLKHRTQDYGRIKLIKSEKEVVLSKQACTRTKCVWSFQSPKSLVMERGRLWTFEECTLKVIPVFTALWWDPLGNKIITEANYTSPRKNGSLFSSIIWNNFLKFHHRHFL